MNTPQDFLQYIESKGVQMAFYVTHDAPWGGSSIRVMPHELDAYINDPDGFFALCYGVNREEFRGWIDSGFMVRCCAKTTKGKQCKSASIGFHLVDDPAVWAKATAAGGYCWTHSEKSK